MSLALWSLLIMDACTFYIRGHQYLQTGGIQSFTEMRWYSFFHPAPYQTHPDFFHPHETHAIPFILAIRPMTCAIYI